MRTPIIPGLMILLWLLVPGQPLAAQTSSLTGRLSLSSDSSQPLVDLLEQYEGYLPPASQVKSLARGAARTQAAARAILSDTDRISLWSGALYSLTVLASRESAERLLEELTVFQDGVQVFGGDPQNRPLSSVRLTADARMWEKRAREGVPDAMALLSEKLNPNPRGGRAVGQAISKEDPVLKRLFSTIVRGKSSGGSLTVSESSISLRLRAVAALALLAERPDALTALNQAKEYTDKSEFDKRVHDEIERVLSAR